MIFCLRHLWRHASVFDPAIIPPLVRQGLLWFDSASCFWPVRPENVRKSRSGFGGNERVAALRRCSPQ